MIVNEKTFNYLNWKSPFIWIIGLLLIFIAVKFFTIGFYIDKRPPIYWGMAILIFLVLLYLWGGTTKIKLLSTGIEYKSLFKSAFIDWKEVKSIGCYVVIRYSTQEIPMNEVTKLNIWGQKFLYVSTSENYVVKWGQKVNNTFIDFHYRPEMLELIKEHMKLNSIASPNF